MVRFTIKVPFFKKDVFCYELTIKQYKILLKSLFTDSINNEFLLNVNSVLSNITTFSKENLEELNFIEYFALLIFIRATSIGGVLPLIVTDDDKKINLEITLNNVLDNLQHILDIEDVVLNDCAISVTVGLPTIKKLLESNNNTTLFIKNIKIKDTTITSINEIENILNVLTLQHINKITTQSNFLIEKIQKMYFFKSSNVKYDIPFLPEHKEILFLIKLLFGESLINIYNDTFYLSKRANISADYLENCTPGEFKIFVKNLEDDLHVDNAGNDSTDSVNNNIEDATSSFEEFAASATT